VDRHGQESYYIIGEGLVGETLGGRPRVLEAAAEAQIAPFRFSRMGPNGQGKQLGTPNRKKIALAMTVGELGEGQIPAGFTYLGQFIDHDLTFDKTTVTLGANISPADLIQGRSPTLDLDSLYGAGPSDPLSAKFYEADGLHLKMGKADGGPPDVGFDLHRKTNAKEAIIPDKRNDENLAVAQTHLAMIRFHNRVVDTQLGGVPVAQKFATAREIVTKHYQWMIRHDYLPRICAAGAVTDVFKHKRKIFEKNAAPNSTPTMPVEFSIAAFRLGHSMVRAHYSWNKNFQPGGGDPGATLGQLFQFAGLGATSGAATPCRASGSPISAGSTTSARPVATTSSSPRSSTRRCASTRRSSTRSASFREASPADRRSSTTSRSGTSPARRWSGWRPASRWRRSSRTKASTSRS